MKADLAIVGAGPAGLATAIHAARRGFDVVVLERSGHEKACGEGLMPAGLRELTRLGLEVSGMPFGGIRYVDEEGGSVEGRFREGAGLGVRRRVLSAALGAMADAAGVRRIQGGVRALSLDRDRVTLRSDAGVVEARLVVGADGLGSFVRRAAGLEAPPAPVRRFGVRAHHAAKPPDGFVEVHWSDGAEAYLTPIGPDELNLAFLWEPARVDGRHLLERFPLLAARYGSAAADTSGAGPLARRARSPTTERVALVGDAAGYVDAITGQGLSLAFAGARMLVEELPDSLEGAPLDAALARYAGRLRSRYRAYAVPASALLWLARRPKLRRRALRLMRAWPGAFTRMLSFVAHAG